MTREEQIAAAAIAISDVVHELRGVLEKSNLDGHQEMDALGLLVGFKVRLYGHQKGNDEETVMAHFLASCSHLLPHLTFHVKKT